MRRFLTSIRVSQTFWLCLVAVAVSIASPAVPVVAAQSIQAKAGADSHDKGIQALAFLPNEVWIHAGGSVTWTFPTDEIHTVTFLIPAQSRPTFQPGGGCPGGTPPDGRTPDGSSKTDANCVNSGPLLGGVTYTVNFPSAGNFKLVCLVHTDMTGVVHVLASETPPHDQSFYDHEAKRDRADLLADGHRLEERGEETAKRTSDAEVTAGIGEIVATTGGGVHTVSVMRFMEHRMVVHVNDTVEWTNLDPVTPHTVTFGTEPPPPLFPVPSAGVTTDSDGARHATLVSSSESLHSGFLVREPQERVGFPQQPPPPVVTRFRVTFTTVGTYNYICALHDDLGMKGIVIVRP
jgi:plastocyanin